MKEFGINPLDDAMIRFFRSDPSGFTKMFGREEADKIRKSMNMKTQKQMEEILQKVSENLTVQFPDYNRAEYDQALIDIKNYQDRLNAIGDHVQGIKRIN